MFGFKFIGFSKSQNLIPIRYETAFAHLVYLSQCWSKELVISNVRGLLVVLGGDHCNNFEHFHWWSCTFVLGPSLNMLSFRYAGVK